MPRIRTSPEMCFRMRIQRDDATLVALSYKYVLEADDFDVVSAIDSRARERGDFQMSLRCQRLRGIIAERGDAGHVMTSGGVAMRRAANATFASLFVGGAS